MQNIERWGRYEMTLNAAVPDGMNPHTDIRLKAVIKGSDGEKDVDGFYDGDNTFRIRFMPPSEGSYQIVSRSNFKPLDGISGCFIAGPASPCNHGPVVPSGTHFRHADGTRCFIMGTTAYVWHHRPAEIREKTLLSFEENGFNKIRMLFFPKHYTGGYGAIDVSYEPPCYPFEGRPGAFDFSRPNPEYFRQFEDRLCELEQRDIIADVILFHPYDFGHWDIDRGMDEDDALLYVKYIVARLSSFRNVWWSLANEYDIVMGEDRKTMRIGYDRRNWDVIGELIKARDPSGHPVSCHNIPFGRIYPDRSWMSHVSYQHPDTYTLMLELHTEYGKPVINDEYQYEGNTPDDWGNCSGALELERHWRSVMAAGYATHGESYIRENNRDIFWAYGGEMKGESAKRLGFLRMIVEKCPFDDMERDPSGSDSVHYYTLKKGSNFYLVFMRDTLPGKRLCVGDWSTEHSETRYKATVYDVWNCVKIREELLPPSSRLPVTEWTAVILEKVDEQAI